MADNPRQIAAARRKKANHKLISSCGSRVVAIEEREKHHPTDHGYDSRDEVCEYIGGFVVHVPPACETLSR